MLYIPMLKTRDEEFRVLKRAKDCFGDSIIPLIEVISEKYNVKYEVDANGEFVRELHGKKMMKVKCKPTEQDVITLPYINQIVGDKKVFIDYFRFSLDKYGKNINLKCAELSYNLNNNYNLYKEKVLSVIKYENMIPVISVKKGFSIPKNELKDFLNELRRKVNQVALRITEEWIDVYEEIIKNELRENDFLLLDMEEQNPETKENEIKTVLGYNVQCNIVLLNSPRKLSIKNGEYPKNDVTDLINNCAKTVVEKYRLDGYGDYCGLKDTMPSNNGAGGRTGAALALLYDYKMNAFYSYCNQDTSLGVKGYESLVPQILLDEKIHNVDADCPGYEKIHSLEKCGSWSTWHYINAVRYIFQVYKNI